MKPDWDKLGDHYAKSESVMIVDVDCTADGQQTCNKMGVKGYPTIKYFTSKTGKKGADYQGGRDFNSLKSFAEKTLNILPCNPTTLANCAANEKAFIEKNKDKTAEELAEDIATKTAELKEMKKEKSGAEAEMAEKQKAWKKKETLLTKALGILKQMEKSKK
jgi:protein disulfide-isomerase A6|uniref:Thioredoxin domain-containing protein n=1 Tax=Eutreptiella gymnastica TaxID=73025 RepID=A0A7S4LJP7_9EUGL|mmetsp:Transcript_72125/g.121005  ORF Transcript_72125/g.121005 Transcript_72125/m.121005 type:complete len:162 (+) Transcript_72125:209-694(+)|eukprot:CAMPEP_0174299514 /NCGR_PEP_ID=MMETSP0809-20121228/56854_1 /TAXON_ID=73025 ORGANISM="Eutreptiella gymnastica-like, Strain CCMP1594" /NCGR_SAMPLE_ID=MMETSP0809 /ASSEMBLY_ACC=CAM_ASM_000658 /LENGTH=161 /DNA_ID=CAMNT_0015404723 /DNA_START=191 /DNA_END=676 /DNA_ORIENTATION=-